MADFCSCKIKLFSVGCVFVAYFVHTLVANQRGCSFSVHGQSEKNSPILLQNDTTLIVPNNGKINLKSREAITVACPDSKNYLVGTEANVSYARCVQGKILRVANQDVNFGELRCRHVVRGTVSRTAKRCGNDPGRIYKIGYPLAARRFVSVIEVCYDPDAAAALYTEHLLYGRDIKYASKSNYRPAFSPEGSAAAAAVAYKRTFQKATFNKLLKSASLADKYINEKSFLARGHLSPDADFLFAATQFTSYYYINVCPQWQVINAGNWKRIELLVRKLGHNLQETLTIISGTHDVLTLPDADGRDVRVYLVADRKLPVPKFVWKLVYSEKSQRAVVLVTLNNPFVKGAERTDFLCVDVCKESGWNSESWSDYERGFVYCCDYKQFTAEVETAPKLHVAGLLQGPK